MGGFLLDTHVLIWLLSNPQKLSQNARAVIQNRQNALYYSPLSFAEMAIKASLGKLVMAEGWQKVYVDLLAAQAILPVHQDWQDSIILQKLPFLHKDPFDRMLISLALANRLSLISADGNCALYDLEVIW
ncbi:PIN domain nuclease, a component of toxin-antitoxin system (PIN domain) [Moraxella cuniculi DSM 21768]|uniref:PIN domain nuclease, a component of toxin-antitoxin system (PIN domain) n=1 Tax=Moraxella cuniculi DSM 21768 TaxID=1122245 RepID=A0A1N7G433_9GAMM|nr:type II toxin-antitoxin system VapC family toxin [Moraxella cuniculi]OOS03274.1 hypothetical protein B0189_09740 [Moraxella cuniculi]SIS07322.1 PIN domain nuclease, a component of toxin-antitoxin system (PIN domain) [Moraxella cuniculi DSM 21768]